jgi:hypothetical protein
MSEAESNQLPREAAKKRRIDEEDSRPMMDQGNDVGWLARGAPLMPRRFCDPSPAAREGESGDDADCSADSEDAGYSWHESECSDPLCT